ncbi:hypothetical protein C8F04DRAFT_1180417 [Mycena alexandri]|uniref:Uncharacterized protein n=1 Tax=Mycena alexandri TaxID=1745969 RepID=A0AAD6T4J6_9AGAR|nr:hypothetical protein C8F04DRAFT_1202967 [Mycena alexandri]KAJ7037683.1 hypothetical protein C8F04DRAFT_1180417 [Mycena alexandri]
MPAVFDAVGKVDWWPTGGRKNAEDDRDFQGGVEVFASVTLPKTLRRNVELVQLVTRHPPLRFERMIQYYKVVILIRVTVLNGRWTMSHSGRMHARAPGPILPPKNFTPSIQSSQSRVSSEYRHSREGGLWRCHEFTRPRHTPRFGRKKPGSMTKIEHSRRLQSIRIIGSDCFRKRIHFGYREVAAEFYMKRLAWYSIARCPGAIARWREILILRSEGASVAAPSR